MQQAYKDGYSAFEAGIPQTENPYIPELAEDLWDAWHNGWEEAQENSFETNGANFLETVIASIPRT